jgi:hypothetical protein
VLEFRQLQGAFQNRKTHSLLSEGSWSGGCEQQYSLVKEGSSWLSDAGSETTTSVSKTAFPEGQA